MCGSIEKRDVSDHVPATEVTSESFLKSLQKGVESVFSSDNVDVSLGCDTLSDRLTIEISTESQNSCG